MQEYSYSEVIVCGAEKGMSTILHCSSSFSSYGFCYWCSYNGLNVPGMRIISEKQDAIKDEL
ncbi:hypothetical protein DPMN_080992 [Dreissena polymorpha]|uniref:Uncharacterized protein n=1 Tax=Dreissena polymorpha TaxID=45954 RepID=A0A9D3Y865_DREPO|nr:hypothetical protein DPMN_080992 [Dreissena polymorpha]